MPDIFNSEKKTKKQTRGSRSDSASCKISEHRNKKEMFKLMKKKHSPFSAYADYPEKVSFVNEDPEEKIILLLRRHPVTNLNWVIAAFFMLIAPFFFFLFPPLDTVPYDYQFAITLVWYLITFAFIFEEFLSWFFHVNIITDERIIEVDFHNLIYREITDANIDQIQDVTTQIGGGLRTFLNYGNVFIQTASEVPRIEFEDVPKPDKVARVLRELRVEEEQEKLDGRVR